MFFDFITHLRHGFCISKSFRFAFGITVRDFFRVLVFIAVVILGSYFGIKALLPTPVKQTAYVQELEKTLAICLTPGDHPIMVGNELYIVGSANTGIRKELK